MTRVLSMIPVMRDSDHEDRRGGRGRGRYDYRRLRNYDRYYGDFYQGPRD
jgi:hypothetical protein